MKNCPTKIENEWLYCHVIKFLHGIFLSIQRFVPTSCSKAVFFLVRLCFLFLYAHFFRIILVESRIKRIIINKIIISRRIKGTDRPDLNSGGPASFGSF